MDVLFYHLEDTDTFAVLPNLLEKCCARGWRSIIVAGAAPAGAQITDTGTADTGTGGTGAGGTGALDNETAGTGTAGSGVGLEPLDAHLWTYKDDSFLPHACVTDDMTAAEARASDPILLTAELAWQSAAHWQAVPPPEALFLIDDAVGNVRDFAAFERCIVLFDGARAASVEKARDAFKAARAAGHETTYWRKSAQGVWAQQET